MVPFKIFIQLLFCVLFCPHQVSHFGLKENNYALRIHITHVYKYDFRKNRFYQCRKQFISTLKTHTHTQEDCTKTCVHMQRVTPFDSIYSHGVGVAWYVEV